MEPILQPKPELAPEAGALDGAVLEGAALPATPPVEASLNNLLAGAEGFFAAGLLVGMIREGLKWIYSQKAGEKALG